jgi:four helix bundle protein
MANSELAILKNAEAIADAIWDRVSTWETFAKDTLGRQIVRSADSMGANIAESCGRLHFGDKIQFLYCARGSLFETKYWVNRAIRRELIDKREGEATVSSLSELVFGLNIFIKRLKAVRSDYPARSSSVREPHVIYDAAHVDEASEEPFVQEEMRHWLTNLDDDRTPKGWMLRNH